MNKSTRLGPAPWRASDETDQAPAERVLAALAEQAGPVTTSELVDVVALHANTVRAHLQELTAVGLVTMETLPPAGRGRPAHQYSITDQGRAVPRVNDPAFAEYRGLTTAFATHLAARSDDPSDEARDIGRAWGRHLATGEQTASEERTASDDKAASEEQPDGADPTRLVMRLLARLGFTPVPPAETSPGEGIALRTCPLLELAEEMPEVICQVHQGLVEGALDQYGSGATDVDLQPFVEPGACRLHLRDNRPTG
ncbi:helix-turn-helix domain-containing protein [Ornithinimicrobium faecis]|uniref:Helix-turn-helix domain-containing protein n=1 Tax=Ornithinimicrobium faecis TaxID=2934158 RepID=A0ABY4Z0M0_9MICO|nr:helix-turn-helix domain-containing protein [Ornithinimicrobium sp. HY1793]USQ82070.1 helix-turn-helix domain-containing protein [Ornithinimicrobium sp. HY1793]